MLYVSNMYYTYHSLQSLYYYDWAPLALLRPAYLLLGPGEVSVLQEHTPKCPNPPKQTPSKIPRLRGRGEDLGPIRCNRACITIL